MKRVCGNNKPKQTKKRICDEQTTICILHDGEDFNDCDNFTLLNATKTSPEEKLHQLQDIRDKRKTEPDNSPHCMKKICDQIPEVLTGLNLETTGYHRKCYQRFTKNLDRFDIVSDTNTQQIKKQVSRSPRRPQLSRTNVFPLECIFCENLELKLNRKTERCVQFTVFRDVNKEPTWKNIQDRAQYLGEYSLYRRIKNEDLFAKGAQFHSSCRRLFNLRYYNAIRSCDQTASSSSMTIYDKKTSANQKAFNSVLDAIELQILKQQKIIELTTLCTLFREELSRYGYPSEDYRSCKLKERIIRNEINNCIGFVNVDQQHKGCIVLQLVYSKTMPVGEAVAQSYQQRSHQNNIDSAACLRRSVQDAFKSSNELPWPPMAEDLELSQPEELLPHDLLDFITTIISNCTYDDNSNKKDQRIVLSICQVNRASN